MFERISELSASSDSSQGVRRLRSLIFDPQPKTPLPYFFADRVEAYTIRRDV
jgi:hypothetical protein